MIESDKTVIPLDDAHEILSVFGIGSQSRGYWRWRRDDGFRPIDLVGVLFESSSVLDMDWKGWLQEAVDTIVDQLANLEIAVEADLDEEGHQGTLRIEGQTAAVKYVLDDDDNFDDVIASINRLIGSKATYRKFRSSEGSDGWAYALLRNEDWQSLDSSVGQTVGILFKNVERAR